MAKLFLHGGVDGERVGDVDECSRIGAEDEAWPRDAPGGGVFCGPGGERVFLGEVEVWVGDAFGGCVFGLRDGGGAEVEGVVLSAGLEEEAFGNDVCD